MALLLHDATTAICYLASVCDLDTEIRTNDVGFSLRVHGFDDKILNLAKDMLSILFSFKNETNDLPANIEQHRFDSCLEILRRRYRNSGMRASSLCADIRVRCLRPTIWSSTEKVSNSFSYNICGLLLVRII